MSQFYYDMPTPISIERIVLMPNDNVRLAIHAACFLTIFLSVVVLVALNRIEPTTGLTWVVTGAGLVSTSLSTAKMLQDRRGGDGQ